MDSIDDNIVDFISKKSMDYFNKDVESVFCSDRFYISNYDEVKNYSLVNILSFLKIDIMYENDIISKDEKDILYKYYKMYLDYLNKKKELEFSIIKNNLSKYGLDYVANKSNIQGMKISLDDCTKDQYELLCKYDNVILEMSNLLETYGILEEFNIKEFMNDHILNKYDTNEKKKKVKN